MYFFLTLFLGWILLNFLITSLELVLQLPSDFLRSPIFAYIFIGYFVCILLHIKSPFIDEKNESPFVSMKKIDLKLFFKDIYYAIWWPYYIVRALKKK